MAKPALPAVVLDAKLTYVTTNTNETKTGPVVAWGRAETDPCERGTVGCCVAHDGDTPCETW